MWAGMFLKCTGALKSSLSMYDQDHVAASMNGFPTLNPGPMLLASSIA